MEQLIQKTSVAFTEEGKLKGLNFKPRQSDVLIVTFPKCGTTWVQQIVHQLRTGGDMEFSDVHEIVPYIEGAYDENLDLEAIQRAEPRCFKSHYWYDSCPKGAGKYIVVYREPCAAAYSLFKFHEGWLFEPGKIDLDKFVTQLWLELPKPNPHHVVVSYFEHLLSWWKHRNDPNVLFLFFEDMKEDLEGVVKVVASFIGINDQKSIQNAVFMSSFDFMKANATKFAANLFSKYRNKPMGVAEGLTGNKVAIGSADKAVEVMAEHTKQAVMEKWSSIITEEIGYQTYDHLRKAFRKERPL